MARFGSRCQPCDSLVFITIRGCIYVRVYSMGAFFFQPGHWPTSLPSLTNSFFLPGLITPVLHKEEFYSNIRNLMSTIKFEFVRPSERCRLVTDEGRWPCGHINSQDLTKYKCLAAPAALGRDWMLQAGFQWALTQSSLLLTRVSANLSSSCVVILSVISSTFKLFAVSLFPHSLSLFPYFTIFCYHILI